MSSFIAPPLATLSESETLEVLRTGQLPADKYRVKSQYLCDFLDELGKSGFVYNSEAQRAFEAKHGLTPVPDCGTLLSCLVYNAQKYRRHDAMIRDGWRPLTPEMVRDAVSRGAKIEVLGENILGGTVSQVCRPVVSPAGDCFVLLPKKRNKGFRADGQKPARIV